MSGAGLALETALGLTGTCRAPWGSLYRGAGNTDPQQPCLLPAVPPASEDSDPISASRSPFPPHPLRLDAHAALAMAWAMSQFHSWRSSPPVSLFLVYSATLCFFNHLPFAELITFCFSPSILPPPCFLLGPSPLRLPPSPSRSCHHFLIHLSLSSNDDCVVFSFLSVSLLLPLSLFHRSLKPPLSITPWTALRYWCLSFLCPWPRCELG